MSPYLSLKDERESLSLLFWLDQLDIWQLLEENYYLMPIFLNEEGRVLLTSV